MIRDLGRGGFPVYNSDFQYMSRLFLQRGVCSLFGTRRIDYPSQYSSTAPYTISLGDTGSPAAKEDTYTERNSLSPFRCWCRYTQSTGYSTKLDHRAFQSYTHSFFFSSFSTPEFYIFPASFASVIYLLAYFCRCSAKLGKGRDSSEWRVCERAKVLC